MREIIRHFWENLFRGKNHVNCSANKNNTFLLAEAYEFCFLYFCKSS